MFIIVWKIWVPAWVGNASFFECAKARDGDAAIGFHAAPPATAGAAAVKDFLETFPRAGLPLALAGTLASGRALALAPRLALALASLAGLGAFPWTPARRNVGRGPAGSRSPLRATPPFALIHQPPNVHGGRAVAPGLSRDGQHEFFPVECT